jgi:hypothetical protein
VFVVSAANATGAPTNCIGAPDLDAAYVSNVEAALVSANIGAVPRTRIRQTNLGQPFANHDPEYNVFLGNGRIVHVTCDDSGDDQCACEIAPQ